MANLQDLYNAILNGKLEQAVAVTQEAINEGISPTEIINQYMVKAMEEIGARFEAGKAFVPNLLLAARAMKGSLELLKPLMRDKNTATIGKVVIGTVKGDLHDIGKNLVASMFEGCGFEVINLGVDVSSTKFIEAAKEHHADIICMSALLTTTMMYMEKVVQAVEAEGLRDQVKIMVGGAPVNNAFAQKIGADAYTSNANQAVQVAKQLFAAS
jgi:corrinoid protein of di/trimethylamine methyltransferase